MDAQEVAENQSQLKQFQRLVHGPNADEEKEEYVYEDENEDEGDMS